MAFWPAARPPPRARALRPPPGLSLRYQAAAAGRSLYLVPWGRAIAPCGRMAALSPGPARPLPELYMLPIYICISASPRGRPRWWLAGCRWTRPYSGRRTQPCSEGGPNPFPIACLACQPRTQSAAGVGGRGPAGGLRAPGRLASTSGQSVEQPLSREQSQQQLLSIFACSYQMAIAIPSRHPPAGWN